MYFFIVAQQRMIISRKGAKPQSLEPFHKTFLFIIPLCVSAPLREKITHLQL